MTPVRQAMNFTRTRETQWKSTNELPFFFSPFSLPVRNCRDRQRAGLNHLLHGHHLKHLPLAEWTMIAV